MSALLLLAGLAILVAGGEGLVRGASGVAVRLGISPVIIGLTVVALGTSAPELAVGIGSASRGEPELAVGNVVGSTIANVLLVLGLSAVASAAGLRVADRLVRTDVPIMVAAAVAVVALSWDGTLDHTGGTVLLLGLAAYLVWTVRQARAEQLKTATSSSLSAERELQDALAEPVDRSLALLIGLIIGGGALLTVGADLLVSAATEIAAGLGVSELVIGLTVIAVGTSAPELATSIVATRRGGADIAVGNAVGSNILNILFVLGTTTLIAPGGLPMARSELGIDLWVMVAAAAACLPVFFRGSRITRGEGAAFLALYTAYLVFLVFDATDHALRDPWALTMVFVVVPLGVITLVVITWRELQDDRWA